MSRPSRRHTPEKRQRADARVNRITCAAIVVATGATAVIGFAVAKEHPGKSSAASLKGSEPTVTLPPVHETAPTTSVPPTATSTPTSAPRSGGSTGTTDTTHANSTPANSTPAKLHATQHGDGDLRPRPQALLPQHPANDAKHYSGNDTPDDNDHHQTTDDHHDPARRDLRRHFAMMARVESAFGERSFRAIGTTATVVVLDPAKAESGGGDLARRDQFRSTSPVVASDLTRSWRISTRSPDEPSSSLPCSLERSRWRSPWQKRRMGRSIRPSATPCRRLAMTGILTTSAPSRRGSLMRSVLLSASGTSISTRERVLSVFPEECGSTSDLLRKPGQLIGPHSGWRISWGPASWSASGAM